MQLQVPCNWSEHVNCRPGWRQQTGQRLQRLASCSLITIEIRDKEAFHWLMLPTVETFYFTVFLFFRVSSRKPKNIFSLIITRLNIYHRCLQSYRKVVTLQHFLKISLQLFQKPFPYMQRIFAACIAAFQFLNHWPFSYIFIPTKFTLFSTCSSISVMTDGQAEKGKSKFITRK